MSHLRYEKMKRLGSGAFGEAWLVRSKHSQRYYVIKELKMSANVTQKEYDSVYNEVNILRSCCHLNIIKYKDFFVMKEGAHLSIISIVMEHADGGDLSQKIRKQRDLVKEPFAESQIRNWFVQISFGLQYLHKKNIIHRDLKTQNIFLCSNKLLKLGDFGISKTLRHENDFATTGIGTPQYMSPEICRQQPYDFKSDIWCLGCVLYEMCALSPAFPGPDMESLVNNIVNAIYKPLPSIYSSSLIELVKVLLRADAARRPAVSQLIVATVLEPDVNAYMNFIKTFPVVDSSSTAGSGGSDFRKDSASSLSSIDGGPQSQG